jgi:hypothetical protein
MNAAIQIAKHLKVSHWQVTRVEEWTKVLFAVVKGLGARFVSKKVMTQQRRLLTSDNLARYRKPQYKVLDQVKGKAIQALTDWFMEEFELAGYQAKTLSEEVIDRVITKKKKAISPTAPDVSSPERDVLESILIEARQLAEKMDSRNELEEILDAEANREEYKKHGI